MLFERYIGIDYSGARTPVSGLPGLRVYLAFEDRPPREIRPIPGSQKHWTRRGVAGWLIETLRENSRTIVGIDHGFSFPLAYFEHHHVRREWAAFLDDFETHWPAAGDAVTVDAIRRGHAGRGALRGGDAHWRRLAEVRTRGAKSVFHFDVPGSVAKSTHAGLPWLRELRNELHARVHFWPFDGWSSSQRSLVAEVYPSLWSGRFERAERTRDQHDAYAIAARLQCADRDGELGGMLEPQLSNAERAQAAIEGWILGVS